MMRAPRRHGMTGRVLQPGSLAALLLLVGAAAGAESPYLVRDLRPGGDELAGVAPSGLFTAGNRVFFCGNIDGFSPVGPQSTVGLWVSDGTASGTQPLTPVCGGLSSSFLGPAGPVLYMISGSTLWRSDGTRAGSFQLSPNGLDVDDFAGSLPHQAFLGNVLYFSACPPGSAPVPCEQLWRTDGTVTGTTLVADLTPAVVAGDGSLGELTSFGGKLYFINPLSSDGLRVLWQSDGSSAGTSPLTALDGDEPDLLTAAGRNLFFAAFSAPGGSQLWVTDGVVAPHPLTQFAANAGVGFGWMKPIGDGIYFLANDGTHGQQLWQSDGTAAGTAAMTGFANPQPFGNLRPGQVELLAGRLLFFAADGTHPPGLWASSGSPQSTTALCPGSCGTISDGTQLVKLGTRVLFMTGTFDQGYALWVSDGTVAGTMLLQQACSSTCLVFPSLQPVNGEIFFPVQTGGSGDNVLWQTDGTAAGTRPYGGGLIRDTFETLDDSLEVAALGGALLFTAPDSGGGVELWSTDGTATGTRQVTDVTAANSSLPSGFASAGNLVFFSASSVFEMAPQLWQSAGTAATTMLVPGVNGFAGPLVAAGGKVFFALGGQLWRADGSAAGTMQLTNLQQGSQSLGTQMTVLQDRLVFVVFSTAAVSLWQSDGTPQGTVRLLDLPPPLPGEALVSLAAAGGLLFYGTLDQGTFVAHLWRSDGTAAGTYQLARLPQDSFQVTGPTAAGAWIYFVGAQDGFDVALWRTDGTVAGTAPVMAGSQTIAATASVPLTELGGVLYFFLQGQLAPSWALWRTDGTSSGTFLLRQFHGSFGPAPAALAVGGQLFFAVDDGVHGNELWASDGTAGGTRLVRDIRAGPAGSGPQGLAAGAGRLFFTADDGVHGPELWESDGTTAGTFLVQDIWPGPAGSGPSGTIQAGDLLFFAADDGLAGNELWALPLTGSTLCRPGSTALCLNQERFKVEAFWRDFAGNSGPGQAVGLTPDTGYFWFFDPASVEVIGKVIDGRALNHSFWFFYGALSNVEYSLTVTDTTNGAARRYFNPPGELASVGDTTAFGPQGAFAVIGPAPGSIAAGRAVDATAPSGACRATAARLCLDGGRFSITVHWQDFSGRTGVGTAVPLTADTGTFWFFSQANVELVLKVLDGRAVNGKFWVFFGALSDVAYTVTVTDTVTGKVRTYTNPLGQFASVADTMAF